MANAEKKALFNLVEAVARELNALGASDWKALGLVRSETEEYGVEEYSNPNITHTDGRQMFFGSGYGSSKGKLHVSGIWPKYADENSRCSGGHSTYHSVTPRELPYESGHPVQSPSIFVSMSRGAGAIAKDIKRRFLPEYTRVWNLCKAQCVKCEDHEQRSSAAWSCVVKAFGEEVDRKSFSMRVDDTYVEFEQRGTFVAVKAYGLPSNIAIELIEFFKQRGGN